jgi:hypothetical protein
VQPMKTYPLVLQLRDLIAGNGFLAHVQVDGRALLVTESDGTWVYGVQPGALAGGAGDRAAALHDFRERYKSVLYDIAADSDTFEDFRAEVTAFFAQVDPEDNAVWCNALMEVYQTNATMSDLPTVKAESVPARIVIELVEHCLSD